MPMPTWLTSSTLRTRKAGPMLSLQPKASSMRPSKARLMLLERLRTGSRERDLNSPGCK